MPFELGIAYCLAQERGHRFFVLEEKPNRLQVSLSDLNGHDPLVHGGSQKGILRVLLDGFGAAAANPSLESMILRTKRLSRIRTRLERAHGVQSPFSPTLFRQLVSSALELERD